MKSFLLGATMAASILACSATSVADEAINLDYTYSGDTGVSLSSIVGGPLVVNTFTDGRSDSDAHYIQRPGKDPLTLENQSVAELLQTTFTQAFETSGAKLGEAGSPMSLAGEVVEMQLQESAQGLETSIRVELTLRNGSRTAWQSAVFSKTSSEGTDAASAIELGLNRLVAELFRDDYFLIALGIF